MLIIQWREEESKKHVDKENLEAHGSYPSSELKEEETFMPSKFSSKENKEDSLDDIDRVQPKTTLTPMTEEGSMAIKEEYIYIRLRATTQATT